MFLLEQFSSYQTLAIFVFMNSQCVTLSQTKENLSTPVPLFISRIYFKLESSYRSRVVMPTLCFAVKCFCFVQKNIFPNTYMGLFFFFILHFAPE
jgi:hypothetical protein